MYFNISRKINDMDNYILYIIRKYAANRCLDILMPLITSMGEMGAIWIIIACVLSLDKQFEMMTGIMILTLAVSTLVGEGIVKHMFKRVRPCNEQNSNGVLIPKPMSYSFPSGHTFSSFAAAEVLSIYFTQYKFIFLMLAFLIALSRLYLYVHYPTDVIAGILFGILCSKLVLIITQGIYVQKFAAVYKSIL